MPNISTECISTQFLESLRQLQKLRNFNGGLTEFWQVLLQTMLSTSDAKAGLICMCVDKDSTKWKTIASSPNNPESINILKQLTNVIPSISKQCATTGCACISADNSFIIAINLFIDVNAQTCTAIFYLQNIDSDEAGNRINALLCLRDIPAQYRMQQSAYDALKLQSRLTDILDLMVILNSQHRFIAAVMVVCNELAIRYKCDRVSLGWTKKGYIRIAGMSHTDNFEKKMEAVEKLEMAMEEALCQDCEIIHPSTEASTCITHDHEAYACAQDVKYLATLPIREKGEIKALISFERNSSPFTEIGIRQLRVTIDQLSTRLIELRKRDRWIGARLADRLKDLLGKFVGFEHTWAKVCGILGTIILFALSFIPVNYRVSSPMILRTDDISYITAPYDGYIDSAGFKPGELVKKGATLLHLDDKDLLLEQAGLLAEKNREQREIEKARATEELADMCIAQARYDQVIAKLETNQYKLKQAAIVSPYDGIIIEGDQQEKIGSPVKQGEILFKIGRIKDIYAEAKVTEGEIQNIKLYTTGQIALSSRPQDLFNITIKLIEPSAVVTEKDNVFRVRCKFQKAIPSWFRPGMTGISKINAGKKTILWIVSHRTIDFIRLKLWW